MEVALARLVTVCIRSGSLSARRGAAVGKSRRSLVAGTDQTSCFPFHLGTTTEAACERGRSGTRCWYLTDDAVARELSPHMVAPSHGRRHVHDNGDVRRAGTAARSSPCRWFTACSCMRVPAHTGSSAHASLSWLWAGGESGSRTSRGGTGGRWGAHLPSCHVPHSSGVGEGLPPVLLVHHRRVVT